MINASEMLFSMCDLTPKFKIFITRQNKRHLAVRQIEVPGFGYYALHVHLHGVHLHGCLVTMLKLCQHADLLVLLFGIISDATLM